MSERSAFPHCRRLVREKGDLGYEVSDDSFSESRTILISWGTLEQASLRPSSYIDRMFLLLSLLRCFHSSNSGNILPVSAGTITTERTNAEYSVMTVPSDSIRNHSTSVAWTIVSHRTSKPCGLQHVILELCFAQRPSHLGSGEALPQQRETAFNRCRLVWSLRPTPL